MSATRIEPTMSDLSFIGPQLSEDLEAGVASIIAEFYGADASRELSDEDYERADEHTRALLDELERLWSRPV